jgi:hypothetical protein
LKHNDLITKLAKIPIIKCLVILSNLETQKL